MSDRAHELTDTARLTPRGAKAERPHTLRPGRDSRPRFLRRVMVGADDPLACQVISAILGSRGYEVSVRSEALGTLATITRERPDVVILDVNMPGLSGDALARLVAQRTSGTRVILHSSR